MADLLSNYAFMLENNSPQNYFILFWLLLGTPAGSASVCVYVRSKGPFISLESDQQ